MKKCEGCDGSSSGANLSSVGGIDKAQAQAFLAVLPLLNDIIAELKQASVRAAAAPVSIEVTKERAFTSTIRYRLGTHNLPDNTRLHKHGTFDYRFETRTAKVPVWADFSHPNIEDLINDCIECLRAAGIAAIIVAVTTESPQAALSVFGPIWRACMISKIGNRANEIDLQFGTDETEHGC